MARLILLGGLHLEGDDGRLTGRAAQKRRLALLALLATPPSRPIPRERLMGYVWPESDPERARHSLSAALSDLRKELGDDLIDTPGDDVVLNAGALDSDLTEFQAALDGDRPERAVELYRGPFLDGFTMPGAVEFEHWADAERQRHAAAYAGALELLAERAAGRGDTRAAADAWRRLATADPFSARVALGYMRALEQAGDRATALQFAKVHEALLREELDAAPHPDVLDLARRLREDPGAGEVAPPTASAVPAVRPQTAAVTSRASGADPTSDAAGAPVSNAVRRASSARSSRRRVAVAATALAGAIVLLSGLLLTRPAVNDVIGVAVLPLENVGESSDTDYFADGLTEEILNALAKVEALRVPARTTAFGYRGRDVDVEEVGHQLGVRYVVGGTVRKSGDRVRISAWLVDAESGFEQWSHSYDRLMGDVFDTQEEIARSIAAALSPRLGAGLPELVQPATLDPDAYNEYLKGRAHWYSRNPGTLQESLAHFRRALEHDPGYGLAHAGIADVFNTLGAMEWGALAPREAFTRSAEAAEQALARDRGLAEGHAALATALFNYHWDWPQADRSFQRALEINPGYVMARHWYSLLLLAADRPEEALAQIRTAREMDPRSAIISSSLARHYYYRGDLDRSMAEYREAIRLDSLMALPHVGLGMAAAARGDARLALESYHAAERVLGRSTPVLMGLTAHAHGLAGDPDRARGIYQELQARQGEAYIPPHALVLAALGWGGHQEAVQWLEAAFAERSPAVIYARTDPILDPLREGAEFRRLMQRVEAAIQAS